MAKVVTVNYNIAGGGGRRLGWRRYAARGGVVGLVEGDVTTWTYG